MAMQKIGDHTTSATGANTDQLKEDLRHLSQTVEELLHASAEDSRESMKEARARLSAQGDRLAAGARESVDCADRYVHDNPWTSVGIGAAAGVVVGMLLGRR